MPRYNLLVAAPGVLSIFLTLNHRNMQLFSSTTTIGIPDKRGFNVNSLGKLSRIVLLSLALGTLTVSCTEGEDDIQCGTPEFPCDSIVTDDMIEV